eukprot:5661765-Pleurochrysis_carterae.AAC.2
MRWQRCGSGTCAGRMCSCAQSAEKRFHSPCETASAAALQSPLRWAISANDATRAYTLSASREVSANCMTSLRGCLRTSTKDVASASLRKTTRHSGERWSAKAIALKPVASSSSAEMCSHRTCFGVSA